MPSFNKADSFAVPATASSAIVTIPATRVATIRKAIVTNHTGADKTLTIYIANDGGAAAAANTVDVVIVAAGAKYYPNLPGKIIPQGGKIYAMDAVGAEMNFDLSWSETTQEEDAEYA